MKKTLLMTLLAGLVGAAQVNATELFITGSTAFRANVHDACKKMFMPGAFNELDDTTSVVGNGNKSGNSAQSWVMWGTPTNALSKITDTLVIHGSFTGSLQGSYAVANCDPTIQWLATNATPTVMTHSPTIAFSDVQTVSSLWTGLPANFAEDTVAIQPFVFVKSQSSGTGLTIMNNITNVTWEQAKGLYNNGYLPLSFWTGLATDTNTPIYLVDRTLDSGTRRTLSAEVDYSWGHGVPVYIFNNGTNAGNFTWVQYAAGTPGDTNTVFNSGAGVSNPNNLSTLWGPGCVGGGDVANVLGNTSANNTSIGYLSFADAQKNWGGSFANWSGLITFEGGLPTAALPTTTQNNDFTPVITGQYPYWAEEVVFYPTTDAQLNAANDKLITQAQLGNKIANGSTDGSILALLDHQSGGTNIIAGSLEYEITNAPINTAIPLYKMRVTHNNVSSLITPGSYH